MEAAFWKLLSSQIRLLMAGLICVSVAFSGDVTLQNGITFRGKTVEVKSISVKVPKDFDGQVAYPIIAVTNGWKRIYVPRTQVPGFKPDPANEFIRPISFRIEQALQRRPLTVANVGAIGNITPFDEFGRRSTMLVTPKGNVPVIQGITNLTPEYATVTALKDYQWEFGIATNLIPPNVLDSILRKNTKKDNTKDRLAIARFYIEADLYHLAQKELAAIAEDFPDLKEKVKVDFQDLMQFRGQQALSDLQKRRTCGQHQLAEAVGKAILTTDVGPNVIRDVQQFLHDYEQLRESIEKANGLLADLQAKVTDKKLMEHLPNMRSTVREELNFETIGRLNPFLKTENDAAYTPDQKLAIAYSSWVVGPDEAIVDLRKAINLWEARALVLAYLRLPAGREQESALSSLLQTEGIGPKAVATLIPFLPPIEETPDIRPGVPLRISVGEIDAKFPVAYWALLPPEYSPHHHYPLLVALRPQGIPSEMLTQWWGGTLEQPGPTQRRGYILIVPEYLPDSQKEYTWGSPAHRVVLESLRDAKRRFQIDSQRVYLAGHNMGGDAAWDIALAHPDEFAAVVPICGQMDHYCRYLWENGRGHNYLPILGDLDRELLQRNSGILDKMFVEGSRFDIAVVEYVGRGNEMYVDEIPRIFEWFEKHRRPALPRQFAVKSLRAPDNQFWWYRASSLPKTYILPQQPGDKTAITAMVVEARVNVGNEVHVRSPSKGNTINLSPEIINFQNKVTVIINGKEVFRGFLKPEIKELLDDFRTRADRQRLFWATVSY